MADAGALAGYLSTIPLLRGIPGDAVARFARRLPAPKLYRPDARDADAAAIYREGDASTALYVVIDDEPGGRPIVQVSVEDDKLSTRVQLWRVYPRDYFGDFEFLAGTETGRFPIRLTKAVPLSPSRVLEIPFKQLDPFIDEHPVVFRRLAREAIARFQQTLEDTLANKVSDPDIALANWIVERARDFGIREGNHVRFRSAVSQESIGRDLGVTRETISLRLNEWRRRGLMLSARGQQFVVRDMERVERIAALAIERSRDEHHAAVAGVDAALDRGDNFRARNFALDVLNYFPGSAELKHRAALAVARCGATREALGLLERFGFGGDATPESVDRIVRSGIADPTVPPRARLDDFERDELDEQIAAAGEKSKVAALAEDILALAPRLWKDFAFREGGFDKEAAREAHAGYRRAFEASGRPYTGVNAASMAFVLGRQEEARKVAGEVLARMRRAAVYWDHASKGEALLLQGDANGAATSFAAALGCADASEGSIAATRLQLARLADAGLGGARDMLKVLRNRAVALYTGPAPLTAAAMQAPAAESLAETARALLRERQVGHVYGGLAAGADIVIAEAALKENAQLHVVLPGPVDDYVTAAVLPAGPLWRERFDKCLAQAASLTVLMQRAPPAREAGAASLHALRHAAGAALAKADALMAPCLLIAAGPAGVPAELSEWEAAGGEIAPVASDGGAPASAAAEKAATSWRPVVFAWLLGADGSDGHLSARGIAEGGIAASERIVRDAAGKEAFVLRRILGGNRPQSALVAISKDARAAVDFAERLQGVKWPAGIAVQVTLDFGPALATGGKPQEERLKDLDTGGGPLEVPDDALVASAAFAMEARLALGGALEAIALGRVARLDAAAGAMPLLPSTEIYALRARALVNARTHPRRT